MRSRRFEKFVTFTKNGRHGRGPRQIVTVNVPGHRRILNAPRAVIHIKEEDCAPVKLGF